MNAIYVTSVLMLYQVITLDLFQHSVYVESATVSATISNLPTTAPIAPRMSTQTHQSPSSTGSGNTKGLYIASSLTVRQPRIMSSLVLPSHSRDSMTGSQRMSSSHFMVSVTGSLSKVSPSHLKAPKTRSSTVMLQSHSTVSRTGSLSKLSPSHLKAPKTRLSSVMSQSLSMVSSTESLSKISPSQLAISKTGPPSKVSSSHLTASKHMTESQSILSHKSLYSEFSATLQATRTDYITDSTVTLKSSSQPASSNAYVSMYFGLKSSQESTGSPTLSVSQTSTKSSNYLVPSLSGYYSSSELSSTTSNQTLLSGLNTSSYISYSIPGSNSSLLITPSTSMPSTSVLINNTLYLVSSEMPVSFSTPVFNYSSAQSEIMMVSLTELSAFYNTLTTVSSIPVSFSPTSSPTSRYSPTDTLSRSTGASSTEIPAVQSSYSQIQTLSLTKQSLAPSGGVTLLSASKTTILSKSTSIQPTKPSIVPGTSVTTKGTTHVSTTEGSTPNTTVSAKLGGLSGGEKAAIGVCVVLFIIIVISFATFRHLRRHHHHTSLKTFAEDALTTGLQYSYLNASYTDASDETSFILKRNRRSNTVTC